MSGFIIGSQKLTAAKIIERVKAVRTYVIIIFSRGLTRAGWLEATNTYYTKKI